MSDDPVPNDCSYDAHVADGNLIQIDDRVAFSFHQQHVSLQIGFFAFTGLHLLHCLNFDFGETSLSLFLLFMPQKRLLDKLLNQRLSQMDLISRDFWSTIFKRLT